jgi:hypothetical protein
MKTQDVSYRKAYKSDHLGVVDLEEFVENNIPLIFTIKEVWFEENVQVAGNKGNHNIAYFVENIKPLVLNSTNAQSVRKLCNGGANLNTWKMPVKVELYIDANVKMKGQIVGGIRIKSKSPITTTAIDDTNALALLDGCATLEALKSTYLSLSKDEQKLATVIAKTDELKKRLTPTT